ncbi:MAG: hypothetical protein NTX03_06825 [Bacteroidetes bacterium]|nr:hypothetical protein [Bacteroidota bacterium]
MMNRIYVALLLLFFAVLQIEAAPISGTYTINPSGSGSRNVKTFNAAVQLLRDSGVNGAVVFNVADGKYSERIIIPSINGASLINNITFISATKDSTKVILDSKNSGKINNYTLLLDGAKYFNFQNITIMRSDSVNAIYARVVEIAGSKNISFNGCIFNGVKSNTNYTVVIASDYNSPADSFINFTNNIIRNGYFGVE